MTPSSPTGLYAPAQPRDGALTAARGLTVSFGAGRTRVVALSEVDLEIHPGELLALLGASGSGKTTLLHALGGLVVPSSGKVLWKGAELSSLDAVARGQARAGGIAYVFQGSNLIPHLSVWENLAFAALVARRMHPAGNAPGPERALALVGLEHKAEATPSGLSGGEQQRVAVARAVVQASELMLCDEPTGHLDFDTGRRVLDMLEALRAELGLTLVIATHDENVAARAGRTVRLVEGRIAGRAG